jgi:hypothetical protein
VPVLFIHGVNVRRDTNDPEAYENDERDRDARLRLAFADRVAGQTLTIFNPYWGDQGATFSWQLSSIPTPGGEEHLGGGSGKGALVVATFDEQGLHAVCEGGEPATALVRIARASSLVSAVEALLAFTPEVASSVAVASELAGFGAKALAYAATHRDPLPIWLSADLDDSQFVEELYFAVKDWSPTETASSAVDEGKALMLPDETLGIGDVLNGLKGALRGVRDGVAEVLLDQGGDLLRPVVLRYRPAATALLGRFFGDIFKYLDTRGDREEPGGIAQYLLGALNEADGSRTTDDPELYVVAHSMGGPITYDLLTHFAPDITCDLLVTVGSQVALFEEMKRYRNSSPSVIAPQQVARPANIRRWINIYDLTDVLAFSTRGVFDDSVTNFEFDGKTLPLISHSAYFKRQTFYERLRMRIHEAYERTPA